MMEILIATQNQHKKEEIDSILSGLNIKILTLSDLNDHDDVIEDGKTFEDNALIKASYFARKHQKYTISDDSGLMVDALKGKPGVHSKRFSDTGLDYDNNIKLLNELNNHSNREASFVSVICFYDPFNNKHMFFRGTVKGVILNEIKGSSGFGYDPLFYVEQFKMTYAEMTKEMKNEISHRRLALEKLKEAIYENINHF